MHIVNRSHKLFSNPARIAGALALALALAGCGYIHERPEIEPDRYAPPAADQVWRPAPAARSQYAVPPAQLAMPPRSAPPTGVTVDQGFCTHGKT